MKTESLEAFKGGQLVFAILRRYRGRGPVRMLLHEAQPESNMGYSYGSGRCWVISPAALMGATRSKKRAAASRRNGRKGGRPRSGRDKLTEAWVKGLRPPGKKKKEER